VRQGVPAVDGQGLLDPRQGAGALLEPQVGGGGVAQGDEIPRVLGEVGVDGLERFAGPAPPQEHVSQAQPRPHVSGAHGHGPGVCLPRPVELTQVQRAVAHVEQGGQVLRLLVQEPLEGLAGALEVRRGPAQPRDPVGKTGVFDGPHGRAAISVAVVRARAAAAGAARATGGGGAAPRDECGQPQGDEAQNRHHWASSLK
jgi:hypothetical protein